MSLSPFFADPSGARAARVSDPAQRLELAELTLERLRAARDADPETRRSDRKSVV